MQSKPLNRILAGISFLYAFVLYFSTMAETVSFWDCGEFIAIGHGLQVSHPPGAPFYMLIGRLFSMFMPANLVAWSVNLISVLAASMTSMLTYLIVVRLLEEWKGSRENWKGLDAIAGYGGALMAAFTFNVTDSHWFNSVEAEVYAISMFFTAIVIWLILQWVDQVRAEESKLTGKLGAQSSRWFLLIAYLFGLATGVHLLNLLAVFFIGLLVFYEKFDREEWTAGQRFRGIVLTGLASSVVFFIIYPGIIQTLPSIADSSNLPVTVMAGFVLLLIAGVVYTQRTHHQLANLFFLGLLVVVIGYSTYALIFIRSNANPPIDENDPESVESIVSYLKREQYGQTPLLSGNSYSNELGTIDTEKTKFFPRRWSDQSPEHLKVYAQYDSDMSFFLNYQVYQMYIRYFLWNFVGKEGDFQGASWQATPNQDVLSRADTPSERSSNNAYYFLPFIMGLFGVYWHVRKDWRRAFALGIFYFVTGIGIILYLNQTPGQPRERDYAYEASFWAFSLWIGIGFTGILELLKEKVKLPESTYTIAGAAVAALYFIAVPGWMLVENYHDHNRKGERVAWDYAWNMLNSVEKDAILFTNGDNDTFPLWYLQEVEGIRRDVRVVNLSLLQTPWYIRQLKYQKSHNAAPVPISLSDGQIENINIEPLEGGPKTVSLPVTPDLFQGNGPFAASMADSLQIPAKMEWQVKGHPYSEEISLLYPNDQAVLNIIETNARQGWKRPIYFGVTVSPDGLVDLSDYLQLEGLATRVVPIKHQESQGRIVPAIMTKRTKDFRFTGLNNPDIYFDDNIRGMTDNYRTIFLQFAQALARTGQKTEAGNVLNRLTQSVDFKVIPPDFYSLYLYAETYRLLGKNTEADAMTQKAETRAFKEYHATQGGERATMYVEQIWRSYMVSRQFDKAEAYGRRMHNELGMQDEVYGMNAAQLKQLYEESLRARDAEQTAPDTATTQR